MNRLAKTSFIALILYAKSPNETETSYYFLFAVLI